jgi:hypothetical protein
MVRVTKAGAPPRSQLRKSFTMDAAASRCAAARMYGARMILARTFLLVGLAATPVADAWATPLRFDRNNPGAPLTERIADPGVRKGTRAYRPDGTAATTSEPAPETTPSISAKDKLDQCLDTWDAGTHITKSKWREICQRQLKSDE